MMLVMLMSVTGAWAEPYLITNAEDMKQLASIINGDSEAQIKFTADIDMAGVDWTPIDKAAFAGVIDGDNHAIFNLTATGGLFRNIGAATIKNLGMENCLISSSDAYCGALAAKAQGTTFINCYVEGGITSSDASAICGGLVGMAAGNTQLTRCYCATDLNDMSEVRPAFVSSTNTGSYQNQPAQNLVDAAGVSTRWIATKNDRVNDVWNIVVTTGRATQLNSIKLWNADNQTYPGRRWKSMKVYGSASSNGEWTEIGSFQDLQLEANKTGLAGEMAINATEEYTYYRVDVLDNEGDNYMQMSDMKFVVTPQNPQYLPVCGSSDGSCTATLCYHYGSTTTATSTPVGKTDVTSGRLAFMLNGCPLYDAGPYFQKLGTEEYPVLKGNNYVYQSIDGTTYSNGCTHRDHTLVASSTPLTCITDGQAEYYVCNNPTCSAYCFKDGGTITNLKEVTLSFKPVIVSNHIWATEDGKINSPGLGYTESISREGTTFHNVTTLSVCANRMIQGAYVVTYTNLRDESVLKFHEFFSMNGSWIYSQNVRYYVNGVERTGLKHKLEMDYNVKETHKEIVIDNLKQYDIIKIEYSFYVDINSNTSTTLYIAQEYPTGWDGKHSFHQVAATYDCVEGGYDQHYECEICGNAFGSTADANSDNDIVPLSEYNLKPQPGGHTFSLSDKKTADGWLKYTCKTANCKAFDPCHFIIPNCIGTTGVEVTTDGETYTAVENNVTIEDGDSYNLPVPIEMGTLSYSRYYPENVWSAWCTPFDVNASYLSDNGLTPAYIEGIHNYDDNEDGTIDRTVMEIVKISKGRLLAGTPLLVRAANGYTSQLKFNDVTMKAYDDIQSLQSSTTTSIYNFIGTYTGTTAAADDNIYSLNNTGAMVHRTGNILPLRWYCQIEQKPSFIGEEITPALARAIYIKVIGEEDQVTGIRTLYNEADQILERADGIFDLNGRELSAPQRGKVNIINGKKQFVR